MRPRSTSEESSATSTAALVVAASAPSPPSSVDCAADSLTAQSGVLLEVDAPAPPPRTAHSEALAEACGQLVEQMSLLCDVVSDTDLWRTCSPLALRCIAVRFFFF